MRGDFFATDTMAHATRAWICTGSTKYAHLAEKKC